MVDKIIPVWYTLVYNALKLAMLYLRLKAGQKLKNLFGKGYMFRAQESAAKGGKVFWISGGKS